MKLLLILHAVLLSLISAEQPQDAETEDYSQPADVVKNVRNKIITPHDYTFTLNNPNICKNVAGPLDALVVVHSSPEYWQRRMSIRRTWTKVGLYASKLDPMKRRNVVTVFVMGKAPDASAQQRLAFELSEFGDIIQEDFDDKYKNLSIKNQMWLRFVKEFCPNAGMVVKADDDTHINIIALLDHMDIEREKARAENATAGLDKKIWCLRCTGMGVARDPGKWQVLRSDFKADYYPPLCAGWGYVLTTEAAIALYEASLRTRYVWLDDVWVTGIVAPRAGVELVPINSLYSTQCGGEYNWLDRLYASYNKKASNYILLGHFAGHVDAVYAGWHSTVLNSGFRVVDWLPNWTWYHPNTYFPTKTHIF